MAAKTGKIGKLIMDRANELGIKKPQLAKKLNLTTKAIDYLFTLDSVQTERLVQLSNILDFNFFQFFTEKGSSLERFGYQAIEDIRKEYEILKQQKDTLQKQLDNATTELNQQKHLLKIMQQTLEMQEAYIKKFNLDYQNSIDKPEPNP